MNRKKIIQNFSLRLNNSMRELKHTAIRRSKETIDIKSLSIAINCSYQMARKYVLGIALPDIDVIYKIAQWLNVSPSWLLFGNNAKKKISKFKSAEIIEIDTYLLKYIITKSAKLISTANSLSNVVQFMVEVVYDASHLDADTNTIIKIVDMMLSSAKFFNKDSEKINYV